MMTRGEHLRWCKQRARDYLDLGEPAMAVTSMMSDLGKHDGTAYLRHDFALLALSSSGDLTAARQFIESFEE